MKIAYFFTWNDDLESGVMKKVRDQVSFWEREGHQTKILVLTNRNSLLHQNFHNLDDTPNISWHCFEYDGFIERNRQYANLQKEVIGFSPDIVYLRKCKFSPGAYRILKQFVSVMELNGKPKPFRIRLGHIYDLVTFRIILNEVQGFVTVGNEIKTAPIYAAQKKSTKVIGNSIDQSRYQPLPPAEKKKGLTFVYIGSSGQPWQGVDKILKIGRMRPSWLIHIIGSRPEELGIKPKELPNVVFHGKMNREEYLKVFRESDIALATLALHRKAMDETSTLKIREYFTCGLPVITGHKDPDFTGNEPHILIIPNYEKNVVDHIEQIEAFAKKWKGKRVDRKLVEHLDVRYKEKERLDFFQQIYDSSQAEKSAV
ncbi:glycosyltransferase [Natronogracilivirga saccharolytica]|nr:glycosyltransferase [Natronogracilivirga saccharolytica]